MRAHLKDHIVNFKVTMSEGMYHNIGIIYQQGCRVPFDAHVGIVLIDPQTEVLVQLF